MIWQPEATDLAWPPGQAAPSQRLAAATAAADSESFPATPPPTRSLAYRDRRGPPGRAVAALIPARPGLGRSSESGCRRD
jgi:hypothetical protein